MNNISDEKFYKWLFENDSIHLNYYYDCTLTHNNPYITYPDELVPFFESAPMKRLKRILQLSRIIGFEPDVYHTRFEHSMGVFNNKKELIKQQLTNPKWKSYIEKNSLKTSLIAELIKSAGHDIGHLPLSHLLETTVIKKHGIHEDIGKRILLENKEIKKALTSIHPNLPTALHFVLYHDMFGFQLLDEGNYDIDRLDYLNRDSKYANQGFHAQLLPVTLTKVDIDYHGNLLHNKDNSISVNNSKYKKTVCVFDEASVSAIEEFLLYRLSSYKNLYFSPRAQILDASIGLFIDQLENNCDTSTNCLYDFIVSLRQNYKFLNLDNFLQWDDIRFYSELIDIIKDSNDFNFQLFGASILPRLSSFFNIGHSLISSSIDYSKPSKGLQSLDIYFINQLNTIVTGTSDIDRLLRAQTTKPSTYFIETDKQKIEKLKEMSKTEPGICFSSRKTIGYMPTTPIFIRDASGKIFTLDTFPKSKFNWSTHSEDISIAFTSTPYLNLLGVSTQHQNEITSNFTNNDIPITYIPSSQHLNTNAGLFGLSYNIDR